MDTTDISRIPFGAQQQHYVSARLQQGRVITDLDWNEAESMTLEDLQLSRIDIIGAFGSPDHGFRIEHLQTNGGSFDFDIHDGILYLGGLRLQMEPVTEGEDPAYETFRTQRDWLQQPQDGYMPVPDLAQGEVRYDLVYLVAYQHHVSAVEDEHLFEAALGGPDTSTRVRNTRIVQLMTNVGSPECEIAWSRLREFFSGSLLGQINEAHELVPDTRLFVDYDDIDDPDDLCAPNAVGGYLGAENQLIRVQLRNRRGGRRRFMWGFDNTAPLYRVQVSGNEVSFLTEPKDQHHWPLANEIVEILPWSAVLANGEKVAEMMGHLSRVESSYNPTPEGSDYPRLTMVDALPDPFFGDNWQERADQESLRNQDPPDYYYLRVWRGIPEEEVFPIEYDPGHEILLGNTGIQISIHGNDHFPGDQWHIAVRPETPHQVMPAPLDDPGGMSPHGVRRYYAPLAIIQWSREGEEVQGDIIRDCRKTFRPLVELETCCTFHVGDGVNSYGDFNSIEEAVRNLPPQGGKICVLSGRHQLRLAIRNRQNIHISGCGETSLLVPYPDPEQQMVPLIQLAHVQNITLEGLNFLQPEGTAIRLVDVDPDLPPSSRITIRDNKMIAGESCIHLEVDDREQGENHIHIANNLIAQPDHEGGRVAIFCLADQVLIERNRLVVIPAPDPEDPNDPREEEDPTNGFFDLCGYRWQVLLANFPLATYLLEMYAFVSKVQRFSPTRSFQTIGGIQIGGGSESVRISENTLLGGRGNGITLGHIPDPARIRQPNPDPDWQNDLRRAKEMSHLTGQFNSSQYGASANDILNREFRRFVYEVTIEDNLIQDMGLSGVGVLAFFDLESSKFGLMIRVEDLTIYRNIIRTCARQIPEEIPDSFGQNIGYGGISLAFCQNLRIEENRIEDNGRSFIEPICGIYILHGDNINISRNYVLNNGQLTSLIGENGEQLRLARIGNRGGIFIDMIFQARGTLKHPPHIIPGGSSNTMAHSLQRFTSDGIPAGKIHDNIVVQPFGKALHLEAMGSISVIGNQFTTQELEIGGRRSSVAGAVLIDNLGVSEEFMRLFFQPYLSILASYRIRGATDIRNLKGHEKLLGRYSYFPSGKVLFANNQTTLSSMVPEAEPVLAAQMITSRDDVAFSSNQSECLGFARLYPNDNQSTYYALQHIFFNTALIGYSIRTSDNRFWEGLSCVPYSLFSLSQLSTTLGNQATNCMVAIGNTDYLVFDHNIEQNPACQDRKEDITEGSGYTTPGVYIAEVTSYRWSISE